MISGRDDSGTGAATLLAVATLSLAMIVRNEGRHLSRCLESVRRHVNEIVIVDTGSTDDTIAIAEREGARIFRHAWTEDFAAARNHALSHVTSQWVLVLDADESLAEGAGQAIRAFIEETQADCGMLRIHEATELEAKDADVLSGQRRSGDPMRVPRLFRNADGLAWKGRIHEEAVEWLHRRGMKVGFIDADLIHVGRVASVVQEKQKHARNLELLTAWATAEPRDYSAHGFLACEFFERGELEPARAAAETGWSRYLAGTAPAYRSGLRLAVARAAVSLALGDFETTKKTLAVARKREGAHPDFHFLEGQADLVKALMCQGTLRTGALFRATASFQRAIDLAPNEYAQRFVPGASGAAALSKLGTCLLMLRQWNKAASMFQLVLHTNPAHLEARLGLIEASISNDDAAGTLEALEGLLAHSFDAWVLSAYAAHTLGRPADMIAILDLCKGHKREYAAPHRAELHLDLLTLRALYEERTTPSDSGVGRIAAIAMRRPFDNDAPRPLHACEVPLAAVIRNLASLRRWGAIDPFFEPRAEALIKGAKGTAIATLQAAGYQIEDTGVCEPLLLLCRSSVDRTFFAELLRAHPAFAVRADQPSETPGPHAASPNRPLLSAVVAPAELSSWFERFPASKTLVVGEFPADLEVPGDAALRSFVLERAEFLSSPKAALAQLFAFVGEPSDAGPLRYLVERYPGRVGSPRETAPAAREVWS